MRKIFEIILICFYIIDISIALQCNGTCASNQVLDCVKCQCIPNLNCQTQPPDSLDCASIDCARNASACPNKCYCLMPSILNNYCPSCLNGGVRSYGSNSCQCICPYGYLGDRCQFALNPCMVDDKPDCANIDCYNTTEINFYGCQRKCLCCANEKCFNLGLLTTVTTSTFTDYCNCNCINTNFSPNDNCLTPTNCIDDRYCSIQFGVYPTNSNNCIYPFVQALCPYSCGICAASG